MMTILWDFLSGRALSWIKSAWSWCCKPPGLYVVGIVAACIVAAVFAHQIYEAGYDNGMAVYAPKLAAANVALAQERSNVKTEQAALAVQNVAIKEKGDQTYALLQLQAAVVARDGQIADLKARIAVFLAAPPSGATELDRWRAADGQALALIRSTSK